MLAMALALKPLVMAPEMTWPVRADETPNRDMSRAMARHASANWLKPSYSNSDCSCSRLTVRMHPAR